MKAPSARSTCLAAGLAGALLLGSHSAAAQECEEIVLGSAISLTGKYATNGVHAKNGYEYAIKKIADAGGVGFGGKCYNFRVIYYDDESKGDRGATLAERLISQDKVQYMLGPYSSGLTKSDRAGDREVPDPDGRGRGRFALAVQQGLPLPVRRAFDLRAVPRVGGCAGRRDGRGGRQAGFVGQGRRRGRERPLLARHSRRRARGRRQVRHEDRGRPSSCRGTCRT